MPFFVKQFADHDFKHEQTKMSSHLNKIELNRTEMLHFKHLARVNKRYIFSNNSHTGRCGNVRPVLLLVDCAGDGDC